eukprot:scaffold53588_cov59-Cyclotella_meneghiniana.AAC.2
MRRRNDESARCRNLRNRLYNDDDGSSHHHQVVDWLCIERDIIMLMSAKKQRIKNRVKRARQRFAIMSDEVLFKKPPPGTDLTIS